MKFLFPGLLQAIQLKVAVLNWFMDKIYMHKRCVLIWKGVLLQQGKGKSINKTLANPIAYAFRTTQNMLEII